MTQFTVDESQLSLPTKVLPSNQGSNLGNLVAPPLPRQLPIPRWIHTIGK
jgi:hypothetical protein